MQWLNDTAEKDCFACGHEYAFIGPVDPAVCPACGGRAVSLVGAVDVQEPTGGPPDGNLAEVVVEDATDRVITYYLSCDPSAGVAKLSVVRFDGVRVTRQAAGWAAVPLPAALQRAVSDALGLTVERATAQGATGR